MTFLTRQEAAQRVGCFDAAAIAIWRRRKHPLPRGYRAAVRMGGKVFPARAGERLHADIIGRIQPMGEALEEGFCYDP